MNVDYLKDAKNLQELKKLYYKLCMQFHPDRPSGNLEIMQKINNEYDYLKNVLPNAENTKKAETESTASMEGFKNIIDILMKYNKITIEIVGSWLWISGYGTFNIKDEILYNQLHCGYSKPQKKFYWYNGIQGSNKQIRGGHLKDAISKYGIIKMESEGSPLLA
jgi:hypothetical protein